MHLGVNGVTLLQKRKPMIIARIMLVILVVIFLAVVQEEYILVFIKAIAFYTIGLKLIFNLKTIAHLFMYGLT